MVINYAHILLGLHSVALLRHTVRFAFYRLYTESYTESCDKYLG